MLLETERKLIVEYGKKMSASRLCVGTAGNISIYDPENAYMLISPSGIGYFDTLPEDIVVMTLDGEIIEGTRTPSSEHNLHANVYKHKPDARAVVHCHSVFATTLSCLHEGVKPVHYAVAGAGASEIPLAAYATYGTLELSKLVGEAFGDSNAVIMANHGQVACGASLERAFDLACTVEWCAEIQWRTECAGKPFVLSQEQMADVIESYKTYGQPRKPGEVAKAGY